MEAVTPFSVVGSIGLPARSLNRNGAGHSDKDGMNDTHQNYGLWPCCLLEVGLLFNDIR